MTTNEKEYWKRIDELQEELDVAHYLIEQTVTLLDTPNLEPMQRVTISEGVARQLAAYLRSVNYSVRNELS